MAYSKARRLANLMSAGSADVPAAKVPPAALSINTGHLADNAVTSAKIGVDVIVAEDVANNAITVAELATDAVSTIKIQDDAVTVDKLANAINTSIAENSAKVTNATHTGDVTGATALTIAAGAVEIAMLSAPSPSSTKFLRGDNTWAVVGGAYSDWSILTADTNPLVIKGQYISNSASALTHTLPAASAPGNVGDTIIMCNAGAGLVTIAKNGSKINSADADGTLPQGNSVQLVYVDDTIGWFEV